MKTIPLFWLALPSLALLAACNPGPKSGRGFVLPEGDAVRGEKAFVELKCYACHRVDGVAGLPAPADLPPYVPMPPLLPVDPPL